MAQGTEAQESVVPFDSNKIFPTWSSQDGQPSKAPVEGIIGINKDAEADAGTPQEDVGEKLLLQYIPRIINILLKFVAPIVMGICLYAGIRFVYADNNEEEITKSKSFFLYALMGVLFIVLSYSLLKVVYFLISPL